MKIKNYFFLLIFFINFYCFILICSFEDKNSIKKTINVFVFVHGSNGNAIRKLFNIYKIYEWYAYIKKIRYNVHDKKIDNFFKAEKKNIQNFMCQASGMIKIDDTLNEFSDKTKIIIDYMRQTIKGKKENCDFYVFNWNGSLYNDSRIAAAELLYNDIIKIQDCYLKDNIKPIFYFITHSHGTTVTLNMERYKDERLKNPFEFLLSFATPISSEANKNACALFDEGSYLFKNICNISSSGDRIQEYDLTNPYDVFTKRYFMCKRKKKYQFYIKYCNFSFDINSYINCVKDQKNKKTNRILNALKKIFYTKFIYPGHFQFLNFDFIKKIPPVIIFTDSIIDLIEKEEILKNEKIEELEIIFSISDNLLFFIKKKYRKKELVAIYSYDNVNKSLFEKKGNIS